METEKLIIMRHAKSEGDSVTHNDFDRTLSRRGTADAARMGQWLRTAAHIPDRIIASSALRAKQTTELMCTAAQINIDRVYWEKSIYAAAALDLLDLVQYYFQKEKSMMLVGHNPAMEELLCYLANKDDAAINSDYCMTTANIAVLRLNKANKNFFKKASAELIVIARPKEIGK